MGWWLAVKPDESATLESTEPMQLARGVLLGIVTSGFPCAVGFALSDHFLGRGIGIFGPAPLLSGILGGILGGIAGAALGTLIALSRIREKGGAALGVLAGVALSAYWASRAFYPSGYVDTKFLLSGTFTFVGMIVGLGLTGYFVGKPSTG